MQSLNLAVTPSITHSGFAGVRLHTYQDHLVVVVHKLLGPGVVGLKDPNIFWFAAIEKDITNSYEYPKISGAQPIS